MAVFRDHDTDSKESLIHHNAGIAGMGGSSYIDSVILRDRDANTAWTAASDATLEERRYLLQNWRADVTTMVNTSGEPVEWYRYTAYGQPTSHPIADVNGDGSVTSADTAEWLDLQSGDSSGSVWLTDDLNRDDVFPSDTADDTFFYAQHAAASGLSSGFDRQSAYGLRKGYAGYEWDDTLAMWHVRHRVLDSKSGKWTRRDPLGYVDGMSDVEYVGSSSITQLDPIGLTVLTTHLAHSTEYKSQPESTDPDWVEKANPREIAFCLLNPRTCADIRDTACDLTIDGPDCPTYIKYWWPWDWWKDGKFSTVHNAVVHCTMACSLRNSAQWRRAQDWSEIDELMSRRRWLDVHEAQPHTCSEHMDLDNNEQGWDIVIPEPVSDYPAQKKQWVYAACFSACKKKARDGKLTWIEPPNRNPAGGNGNVPETPSNCPEGSRATANGCCAFAMM